MSSTDRFEDRLRHELLAALPAHRRRRRLRDRALVVMATSVLVLGLGWAVAARDGGSTERASTGPAPASAESSPGSDGAPTASVAATAATESTSTSRPTTNSVPPSIPGVVPGGPALTPEAIEASRDLVARFLGHLRVGDLDAAAPLVSEYATMTGPPGGGQRATVEAFATDQGWLLADTDPELLVTPSPGWQVASPIVTVVVETGSGAYRAAAFVLNDGLGGPSNSTAAMQIQRLPEGDGPATTPAPGTPIGPGQEVTFPGGPTEGGVRIFVDHVEVRADLDGLLTMARFTVPPDVAGGIVVTRSVATPELPEASAAWYPVEPAR